MEEKFSQLVPLLLFTALMVCAVGIILSAATISLVGTGALPEAVSYVLFGFGLALAGVLTSLLHLGRKKRFALAALGLRHSWLSREVVLCTLFVAGSGITVLLYMAGFDGFWTLSLLIMTALIGMAALVAVGMVYALPGQIGWRGVPQASAAVMGAVYLTAGMISGLTSIPWAAWAFWVLLVLDAVLSALRFLGFARAGGERHAVLFPRLRPLAKSAFGARVLLGTALPGALFFLAPAAVPMSIALAVFLDRFIHYAGTAQRTPEAELARIRERRMREAAVFGQPD